MGTFSIWHLLIGLLIVVVPLVVIAWTDKAKKLARLPYFWRFFAIVVLAVIELVLDDMVTESVLADQVGEALISLALFAVSVAGIIASIFLVAWTVHRIQDIGWSKWVALVLIVPLVNLIFVIVVLFVPGRPIEAPPREA